MYLYHRLRGEMAEVLEVVPLARIQQRTVELILEVPVPQIIEDMADVPVMQVAEELSRSIILHRQVGQNCESKADKD